MSKLTNYQSGDIRYSGTKSGVRDILDEKSEDRFQEHVVASGECDLEAVSVDEFFDQGEHCGRGNILG